MEGGDGVLAIVRAPRHAGLAVTLLPEAYFKLNRRKCVDIGCTRVRQSSVETNTKRILQHVSRYDVSYQVSNYTKPSFTCDLPCSHKINSLFKNSHHVDPFIDSLRKYPVVTSSADFIRKVLKHTQFRHKKRHLKSFQALIKPRSQQTYKTANSQENAVNTTQQGFCSTGTSSNHPLATMEERCSSQKELINYTYDYLKSESLVPRVDVRYFTEVKKAIRRRLRSIINKKSTQCPVMASRYDHHKRHGKCMKSSPRGSLRSEIKTLTCDVSSNIINSQSKSKPCFCHHPLPCDCKRKRHDPTNNIFTNSESDQQKKFKLPVKQTIFEVGDLKNIDNNMENEKIFKEISKWIKEMPVYSNFNETYKLKQEAVMKKLAKTLKFLLHQTDFVPKVKPEIVKCLNALPIWRPNEPTDEANFIDDLVNKLIKRFTILAEHNFAECITKIVQDLPFEDGINNTHIKHTIDKFITKLKPLALNRPKNDQTYKEILKLKLIDLLNDLNLKLDKRDNESIDVLADNIADQLCHMHLYNYSNERKVKNDTNVVGGVLHISFGAITEWLLNIPGLSEENLMENKKAIENLASSLKKIQMRDNNSDNQSSDMNKLISNWLHNFLRKNNVHLDPKAYDKLVNKLISKLYNVAEPSPIIPKTRKRWDDINRQNFSEIKEAVKTMDDNINMQNKSSFPINLSSKSTQTMHEHENKKNENQNSTKNYRDIENLSSPSHMSQNETDNNNTIDFTGAKTRKEFLGPRPLNASTNITKNNEDERTSTSIEEYHSDSSSILRNINAISKKILDKEFGNLKAYKESNKSKIPNTVKDNSVLTSTLQEKLLLYDNFTTSTPLESSLKGSICDKTTSIDYILLNGKKSVNKKLSDNTHYLHRFECVIYDWLKTLGIGVKDLEKRNLAESIASDFLDRKRYLELSGSKTCEIQELEQLKYQIYRRLYNFTTSETLPVAIAKVNDLHQYLIKLSKQTNMSNEISNSRDTESFTDLKRKIKSWLNFIPSQLYISIDKNKKESLIKDLITKVHDRMRSGNYEDNIKREILLWLPKLLKVQNKNELNDLAENLKSHIENIYSIDTQNPILSQDTESYNNLGNTQIPIQDSSEFVVENFRGVVLEWLRNVRPVPRNVMTNTSLIENFSSVLANDLKKVFKNNSNIWSSEFEDLLIKEVAKNLKNLLCDQETESLYQALGIDFIAYLKQIRLFHDLSDRIPIEDECKYENEIRKAVIIWSQNLLLQSDKSFKDIEEILNNFVDILSTYMRKDIDSIENRLREDTLKILKVIPLKIHQLRHEELEEHIKSLVNIMRIYIVSKGNIDFNSTTKEENSGLKDSTNLQPNISNIDNIRTIIKSWCDNIPLYVKHSDGDRAKLKEMRQNIASDIIYVFDELNKNAIYSKDDFYELLRSEIKKLLKNMPMSRELENCLNMLIDVVIVKLKDVTHEFVNREKKESVTSTYKLLLHEAINKTLSLIDNPTIDEQISFNLLKEKLANAFIELHHPTNDDEIRNKYKDKLCDEIDKFCKDYLNQSIIIPVNSEKVKDDLDKALKNVSLPTIGIQNTHDFSTDNISPKTLLKIDASTQLNLIVPRSTLSANELEHMQRIRARSNIRIESRKIFQKDVSTSPLPMDMATQTEVNTAEEINQTSNNMVLEKPSLWREVSPQVIVKEFYWDSSGSKQSLLMCAPSEISQRIEHTLTTKSQTDKISNKTVINSKKSLEIIQTHEDTGKNENPRAKAIPKHMVNSLQQTSNTLTHPIVSCTKSYIEGNQKELEPDLNEKELNRNLERREVRSDPISSRSIFQKAQRIGEGTEENEGDIYISRNRTRKNIYENLSKRIPEDQHIEGDPYTQCHKDDRSCGCKDNISTKCRNRMFSGRRQRDLKHCAKSFVCFCPHPSNFFFNRDF